MGKEPIEYYLGKDCELIPNIRSRRAFVALAGQVQGLVQYSAP
jgi:hypothetical protein